jgi:hypothetical protein
MCLLAYFLKPLNKADLYQRGGVAAMALCNMTCNWLY